MSSKQKKKEINEFNDTVLQYCGMSESLISKLKREEISSKKLINTYVSQTDRKLDRPEKCVEKFVRDHLGVENDQMVALCKLLSMNMTIEDSEKLSIQDLFTICGYGTKFNEIKFDLFHRSTDQYIEYKVYSSKYFLEVLMTDAEHNLPDDLPGHIQISLSHDMKYAIIRVRFGYSEYYFYAPTSKRIYLNAMGKETTIYKDALTNFIAFMFRAIQAKWERYIDDDIPLDVNYNCEDDDCCDDCDDECQCDNCDCSCDHHLDDEDVDDEDEDDDDD